MVVASTSTACNLNVPRSGRARRRPPLGRWARLRRRTHRTLQAHWIHGDICRFGVVASDLCGGLFAWMKNHTDEGLDEIVD